ncbi:MAG: NAD-dependent epimerase/dehydratase family protein [Candidatus Zixiibacteriota bacterium]
MSGNSQETSIREYERRVAILGGSGFIGSSLMFYLMQLGYQLHALYNKKKPELESLRNQIKLFQGSIDDEASLRACFEGCDEVFHLVGIIAETRDKTFDKTVAQGTQKVVAAAKAAGVKKIYYLSALGTAADAESKYHQSKWAAEQAIVNSGLDYTIFRPSVVFGPDDAFINMILKMVRLAPLVPVIGDGKYQMQPVYVEELCAVMADATRRDFTSKKIYEIGGAEPLTYLEILDIIKRATGMTRKSNIHLPLGLMRVVAAVLEKIMKPAPFTRDQLKMMAAGSTCNQTIVEKEFGVKFSSLEFQILSYVEK